MHAILRLIPCLLAAAAVQAQPYLNLDFETAPRGSMWGWGAGATTYEFSPDAAVFHSGAQSLRIRSLSAAAGGLGVVSQYFPIELVRGHHVRVSGWMKTDSVNGYAAVWWRVDGTSGTITLDNMSQTGPRGTTDWAQYSFERDVSPNGAAVVFGVFLSGTGTAWFDGLAVEIDGVPFDQGPAPYLGEPKPEQLAWLNKTAIQFKGADPALSLDDLQPLKSLIGNARIVALGEDTHGTSEFFRMKHRIVEFLASQMGFTVFAIEANMPEAYAVNDYVLNGRGDPKELLKGMYFWTWNTQEVLDMILWMRQFNQSGKGRIQFTGFDCQTARVAAGIARDFIAEADPDYLPAAEDAYALMTQLTNTSAVSQRVAAGLAINAVREHMELNRENYLASYASADVDWAIQNARVAEQATWIPIAPGNYRDQQMALNTSWIVNQQPPGTKVVLWAHNGHVARPTGVMGSYLAAQYGSDYVVLGFAFHDGSYNAAGPQGLKAYPANPSFPGSFEYVFHKTGMPQFILDLRKASADDAGAAWLLTPMMFRNIGAVPVDGFFMTSTLTRDYDALIYFEHSTPSKLLGFN